jgi:zinc D-Ala-D-Ala carboxypeptidase
VAEQTTRVTLSTQISLVDSMLDEPFFTRPPSETADARQPLEAASGAVRASMVQFARDEVTAARKSLATAGTRGQKVYDATEGKGADDAVRARLRSALDTLTTVDEAAEGILSSDDLAELRKTALDLSSNRSVVGVATDAMITAQDAATCPAADQMWDPDSGFVPESDLAAIPWSPTSHVRADVLEGLVALDAAYQEAFGEHLTINSSYRTYAEQQELYDPSSPIAFPPGCSNHGLGLAVDIGGGVETFGTEQYNWLKENAKTYGWTHPAFAEPDGRVPEPWHWQSVLAPEGP